MPCQPGLQFEFLVDQLLQKMDDETKENFRAPERFVRNDDPRAEVERQKQLLLEKYGQKAITSGG